VQDGNCFGIIIAVLIGGSISRAEREENHRCLKIDSA
jgi:hypothetical protein